ncbi:uncharacterized protein PODANS_1_10040 [Podospora anserina S mat+]|uniref:Podospora anserina S mat+ genomic DNA chromosome 1, supercontig 2 n=1 Tax=Podospora anserina (strain S / ATCC MYA-4624 / DSM 980 / FGSC 10383) TaxID=515849 RepID=B2AY66_PODAN|nr:uncharacterized protein PODANS_1_10040 [Podospora anserina S mat+]CAP69340.1 unnamed protein product [Podospora anserina S mat+]CDP23360.1 Putative protein of unknown function [Podospora anserina S mat+]
MAQRADTSSSPAATSPAAPQPLSREGRTLPSRQPLMRKKSAQDRINEILEGARERAESYGPDTSPGNLSPRLQPLLDSSLRGLNYLSTNASPRTGSPRLSPSIPEENGVGNIDGAVTAQPQQQHIHYYNGTQTNHSTRRRSTRQSAQEQGRSASQADDGTTGRRHGEEEEEGGWKKTLKYFRSIELENKGSVARDHLALERTFLAWLRTSLAFASIGIAITQLFRLNTSLADDDHQSYTLRHLGKPLGSTFLAVSILILFLGYNRYLESQAWVIKGKFPASRGTIILVSFIAFAVTVASLVVVIAVQGDH